MANTQDLLGSLLRRGLSPSSASRIEHSLGENGIGGLGGILEQLGLAPAKEAAAAGATAGASRAPASAGGAASATRAAASSAPAAAAPASAEAFDPLSSLGALAKSIFGEGAQGKSLAAGGLGALAGAILGGGGGSAKGAMKGGALALLGSIALQALRGAQQKAGQQSGQPGGLGAIDPASQLAAGLRAPQNDREEQEVSSIADLTVKAMINAAKVDGRIDEDEMQKFVGELQADGLSQQEREYLLTEVRKPLTTAEIVRAVPNQQVAAQVYAASLLAIEVDTEAEKNYLQTLARDLKLDPRVIQQIHQTLGV